MKQEPKIEDIDFSKAEERILGAIIEAAKRKLKDAHEYGPGAPDVTLTAEEACIVYRLLFGDARR